MVVGMEDMGAVLMHMDALDLLAKDVPAQMRALFDDKAAFPVPVGEMSERSTEQAGTDNQIIIFPRGTHRPSGMFDLSVQTLDIIEHHAR